MERLHIMTLKQLLAEAQNREANLMLEVLRLREDLAEALAKKSGAHVEDAGIDGERS